MNVCIQIYRGDEFGKDGQFFLKPLRSGGTSRIQTPVKNSNSRSCFATSAAVKSSQWNDGKAQVCKLLVSNQMEKSWVNGEVMDMDFLFLVILHVRSYCLDDFTWRIIFFFINVFKMGIGKDFLTLKVVKNMHMYICIFAYILPW